MDILEGNKLIGVFLGAERIDDDEDNFPDGYYWQPNTWEKPLSLPYLAEDWEFHSNWNWIMPVISRIKNMECDEYTLIDNIDYALTNVDIYHAFVSVVEYVEWYSKQKESN